MKCNNIGLILSTSFEFDKSLQCYHTKAHVIEERQWHCKFPLLCFSTGEWNGFLFMRAPKNKIIATKKKERKQYPLVERRLSEQLDQSASENGWRWWLEFWGSSSKWFMVFFNPLLFHHGTISLLFILAIMLSITVESTHWKNIGILVKWANNLRNARNF